MTIFNQHFFIIAAHFFTAANFMNTDFLHEYNTVRENGAGFFDFPGQGLIEVSGGEAVQFLNGLVSNDVAKLADNSWMLAAFPNAQGRLLALVRVMRRGDKFLFEIDVANYEKTLQNLNRFTFAGDFKVADLSDEFSLIAMRGRNLPEFDFQTPSGNEIIETDFKNAKILVSQPTFRAENGFDFFVPANLAEEFKQQYKLPNISEDVREVLRVENGIPKFGVDMDETTIVPEIGLTEAISYNKGCYIGQEIIARIHFRGHVAKRLSGLILEENVEIKPNDELKSPEGKNAGRITSTVFSLKLQKRIALGYVRYEFLAPETKLRVTSGENEFEIKVVGLPFV